MISPTFTHISKNIRSKVRASLCYLQNSFREDHLLKSNGIQTRWAAAAKSLQSCPTLSDFMDCSLPGSSIQGIFQARVLEWGAVAFSMKRSLVFPILLFSSVSLHWTLSKAFLSLLALLWNSAFKWVYPFLLCL